MAKESAVDISEFMALSDGRKRGRQCAVGRLAEKLTPGQMAKFEAAMTTPDITSRAIAEVLHIWGAGEVSYQTVRRHRIGECACSGHVHV